MWLLLCALSALAQDPSALPEVIPLHKQIEEHFSRGELDEALVIAHRVLEIRRNAYPDGHPGVADSLSIIGQIHAALGDYDESLRWYQQGMAMLEEELGPDEPGLMVLAFKVAETHHYLGDYGAALVIYERALTFREQTNGPNHISVVVCLNSMGLSSQSAGNYDAARAFFTRSLTILDESFPDDHGQRAGVVNNIALLEYHVGNYSVAGEYFGRAIALWESEAEVDKRALAMGLLNLGGVRFAFADMTTARSLFERSVALLEEVVGPDHPDLAYALNSLGIVLSGEGDLVAARHVLERSLAIRERALGTDHPVVAVSLKNVATIVYDLGDIRRARSLSERGLQMLENALGPDHPEVGTALYDLSVMLISMGENEAARPLLERSLGILEETLGPDHPKLAYSLTGLGRVAENLGEYDAALAFHRRTLAIQKAVLGPRHPDVGGTLGHIGSVHYQRGELSHAVSLLTQSLELIEQALGAEHPDVARRVHNLGRAVAAQGNAEQAGRLFERTLQASENRFELLDSLSEREALAFVRNRRAFLDSWLDMFAVASSSERAYSTTLRWKGVATRRVRARNFAGLVDDPKASDLLGRLAAAKREMAGITYAEFDADQIDERRQRLALLTVKKEELERALAVVSQGWVAERDVNEAGAAEVCTALSPGAGLVDFLLRKPEEDASYLAFTMVAPACEVSLVDLGPAAPIDAAIRDWRAALADQTVPTWRTDDRGQRVAAAVWAPLSSFLADADQLVIVPDGPLSSLPFAALPLPSGAYLVEEHAISYVSDARDLLRSSSHQAQGALIVGDVDFGGVPGDSLEATSSREAPCVGDDFKALPFTADEVESVRMAWGRGVHRREEARVATGIHATEASIAERMSGTRIVHFATHGFFASGRCENALQTTGESVGLDPLLLSGVVLAGANVERAGTGVADGILTAQEISALDLRGTELVVLSACETGLGEVTSGEGVLGLQRGFSVAGAKTLVMSLWNVPDEETAALMDAFYQAHLRRRKGMTPSEALRFAQLEVLEENYRAHGHARPSTWAAFLVAGQPSR